MVSGPNFIKKNQKIDETYTKIEVSCMGKYGSLDVFFLKTILKSAEPVGKIWFLENILFWKTLIFKNGHPKVDKTGQIIFDKLQTHQVSLYRCSMHGMAVWRNLFCKSYGTCYLEFLIRLPEPFLMGFQRKKNT